MSAARAPTREFDANSTDRSNNVPVQETAYPRFGQQQERQQIPPVQTQTFALPMHGQQPVRQVQSQPDVSPIEQQQQQQSLTPQHHTPVRQNTDYREWLAPATAGAGVGALGTAAYKQHNKSTVKEEPSADEVDANNDISAVAARDEELPSATVDENNDLDSSRGMDAAASEYPERASSLQPAVTTADALPTSTVPAASAGTHIDPANYGRTTLTPSEIKAIAATATETVPYRNPSLNATADASEELGGLEREGAHGTGHLFPAVIRHESTMSVSQLHVPGEFPAGTEGGVTGAGRGQLGAGARTNTTGSFLPPSQWELVRE